MGPYGGRQLAKGPLRLPMAETAYVLVALGDRASASVGLLFRSDRAIGTATGTGPPVAAGTSLHQGQWERLREDQCQRLCEGKCQG